MLDRPNEITSKKITDLENIVSAPNRAYTISADAIENYRIKKGLREVDGTGVMAGVTNIGNAHGYVVSEAEKTPVDGKLEYRKSADTHDGYRAYDDGDDSAGGLVVVGICTVGCIGLGGVTVDLRSICVVCVFGSVRIIGIVGSDGLSGLFGSDGLSGIFGRTFGNERRI